MLLAVLSNLNTRVLDFCVASVGWSVWVHGFFMVFHLWISPGFICGSCS